MLFPCLLTDWDKEGRTVLRWQSESAVILCLTWKCEPALLSDVSKMLYKQFPWSWRPEHQQGPAYSHVMLTRFSFSWGQDGENDPTLSCQRGSAAHTVSSLKTYGIQEIRATAISCWVRVKTKGGGQSEGGEVFPELTEEETPISS